MKVLVVLKHGPQNDLRVLVNLHKPHLRRKFSALLEQERGRDALDLVISRGMVDDYLPPGRKLERTPDATLIEDLLV